VVYPNDYSVLEVELIGKDLAGIRGVDETIYLSALAL